MLVKACARDGGGCNDCGGSTVDFSYTQCETLLPTFSTSKAAWPLGPTSSIKSSLEQMLRRLLPFPEWAGAGAGPLALAL
eukprot:11009256-Lingulodinium_polyedra.AAC.1